MLNKRVDKIMNEVNALNFDSLSQIIFWFDFISTSSEIEERDIVYTKAYFARYYAVDVETFHKWVRIFCPSIWEDNYKRKRKFTREEAELIFDKLGRIGFNKLPPQTRKELINEIYRDCRWKKSKAYQELAYNLEDHFSNEISTLKKLPPNISFQVLNEELEGFDDLLQDSKEVHYRMRMYLVEKMLNKYQNISEHKLEVYKRYMRMCFSKED